MAKSKNERILDVLSKIPYGRVTLTTPEGKVMKMGGRNPGPDCEFQLKSWQVFDNVIDKGEVAFGEDYMNGNWTTNDLSAVMNFLAANQDHFDSVIYGNLLFKLYFKIHRFLRRNTKENSKGNISYHYDLGNDFYTLWLDKSMTYSSALYNEAAELEEAQKNKYLRILEKLDLKPRSHILEVGCGWGGFAETAARSGHRVTAITISKEQQEYAKERIKAAGLSDLVEIRLIDYRDLKQKYDGIVSIEMFEAVGKKFWPTYFRKLQRALKPGAKAIIQTIIIEDKYAKSYQKSSDFIRQYIFPGGMLPSLRQFAHSARQGGLKIKTTFEFGQDYALTLDQWHKNFDAKIQEVLSMGFKDDFIRMWKFYLGICSAGFRFRRVNVMQAELVHV
jgi:cyclopropane-fatty-acyl-phospholipid synthase